MANDESPVYPTSTWRLILHAEADGATNMAIDEAIMDAVAGGASPATLRFYAWSPPCLSLGRNQPLSDADLAACRAAGVDIVRRPTGGRAILHTDELTYSVALLQSDPRATGDVVASYRRLSLGLLAGLRELGAEVDQAVGQRAPNADLSAVCFETPSNYEIVAGGRKLVGSAQWRARGGVLQHGSLPLHGNVARIVDYLALPRNEGEAQRHRVRVRATTLEEALGRVLTLSSVARSLAHGFAQALSVTLVHGDLTADERTLAAELRRSRYAASEWAARVPE